MPVVAVCDECRAEYRLKDEYAGTKLKCKGCGSVIVVPVEPRQEAAPVFFAEDGPFGCDRYLINQKRLSISEKYYVHDEEDNPILFVERPAHFLRNLGAALAGVFVAVAGIAGSIGIAMAVDGPNTRPLSVGIGIGGGVAALIAAAIVIVWLIPRRHISIYADDTKEDLLLEVFQDQKVSFIQATYTIRDPRDGLLGQARKNYLYNFVRKRWDFYRPDGTLLVVAREDSLILSLMRRLLGPMLGLLRTNFIYVRPGTEEVIGEFNRRLTIFDRYVLDMTADRRRELDRRVGVALGILLDTGEHR